jgi:hypothetical protein
MSFTYDLETDIGVVRLRIGDTTEATALFTDEDLTAFLSVESDTWRASAAALERIALDQVLLLKVVKILPMSVDGAKVAEMILKIAKGYRDQALTLDAASGDLWDSAEIASTNWAAEHIIWRDWLAYG